MAEKTYPAERTGKGCWYKTVTTECVLCGAGETYRVRQYGDKPVDVNERYEFEQYACGWHFV